MAFKSHEKLLPGKKDVAKVLNELGGSVIKTTVEGGQKMLCWFKDFFQETKEKGIKATLIGPLVGFLALMAKTKTEDAEKTEGNVKNKPTASPAMQSRAELMASIGPIPTRSAAIDANESPAPDAGYITDEKIVKKLDSAGQRNALHILNYSKEICRKFGIPFAIYREIIGAESSWNPLTKNPKSSAAGLGQFLDDSWDGFISYCNKNNIHDPKWGGKPLTPDHRYNPYCSIYATAWSMNNTKKDPVLGKLINSSPIHVQAQIYYLAHHEGAAGAKKYLEFLNMMRHEGFTNKNEMLAAYNKNPEKYNNILHPNQVKRIIIDGMDKLLYIYFTLCKRIGNRAYASTAAECPVTDEKIAESPEKKYKASEVALIGDSYAEGQWGKGGLKSTASNMGYFARYSTKTTDYMDLINGKRNRLLPPEKRGQFLSAIKNAKLIYIKLGGNEYQKGAEKFKENMRKLIEMIKQINPDVQIVIAEIGPSNPLSQKKAYLAAQYRKKDEINQWIRSGGNGLFRPLIWAHLVQDKNDPGFIAREYADNDKIHINQRGFQLMNTAFLREFVKEDERVAAYIKKYEAVS